MDKIITFDFKGKCLFGVANCNFPSEEVVLFLHGIPGDRVDSRRLPVRIARLLNDNGISSLRVDLYATSFSNGNYEDVTLSLFKECIVSIIRNLRNEYACKKVFLVAFSEAGKIALKVQEDVQADGICFCNAIVAQEKDVEELGVNKFYRRNEKFVIDIQFGVWINLQLIKEKNEWSFVKRNIPENDYLFIYGSQDLLTENTLKLVKTLEGKMIEINNEDHLFTSGYNDERLAKEILDWIHKKESCDDYTKIFHLCGWISANIPCLF